jgi:hypothetical protein|uniref:Uncharacterized protein n=1 Tax=Siphoviridae sp. ctdYc1 TaxID=2826399 RepID=A0A8S5N0F4_9CAUD|nr:MAG TPA: hypothetical protein [Siphoviridae sp. ctdYc1]
MNISQDFSLTASVWDGDKFLIEAATANGSRQMKVTAEVVRAYLNGTAGPSSATDRRVLPFRGFMDSGEISPSSAATALPLEVWFVRSAARFAVAERSSSPVSSSAPPKLYDNWEGRSLYNDGLSPAAGNLYVCQSDDRPYWWTGAELRPIVTDTTGQVIADAIPLDEIDAITAAASRPSSSSPAKSPASLSPAAEVADQAEEVEEAEEAASQEEAPAAVAEPVAETTETEAEEEEEKEPKAAELIDTTLRSASLVDTTLRSATIIDKSKRSATIIDKSKHSATIIDKSKRSADVTTVTPSARIITVG